MVPGVLYISDDWDASGTAYPKGCNGAMMEEKFGSYLFCYRIYSLLLGESLRELGT